MTAEIAIMNRTAVTLATDSAVTLTVRGSEKIYNSADKLFELSDRDPLGVMIYNNLEFMGVALEVAIRQFRQRGEHFESVFEAADAFFKYLLEELKPDDALQKQHAEAILYSRFLAVRSAFDRAVSLEVEGLTDSASKTDAANVFLQTVQARITLLQKARITECFSDTPEQAIADFYAQTIASAIEEVFEDLPLEDTLRGWSSQALAQRICSSRCVPTRSTA